MKSGRTLVELANELERQRESRRDFIAPMDRLTAVVEEREAGKPQVALAGLGDTALPVTALGHEQLASELEIPKRYYDRMATEAPALLAENMNHWLLRAAPKRRLVRTLDGRVRAFLSDAYRPLDNVELAEAVLPVLTDIGARVDSCELTERRLFLKIILPSLSWDMAVARREAIQRAGGSLDVFIKEDVVQAALTISNSEVGDGSLRVEESLNRLVCLNLATVSKTIRKYHVGRRHDGFDESVNELLSTEARQADDRAFWLKVRDVVRGAFDQARFERTARRFAEASGDLITVPVEQLVDVTAVKFGFTDTTRKNVLQHLAAGGELSRFGLINAVTRAAADEPSYDVASELERVGGRIIELPKTEWAQLTKAA